MKFLFISDKFGYIHPTLSPRKTNDYSHKEKEEAENNTNKVSYDKTLFEKSLNFNGSRVPKTQYGSLLVLPESSNTDVLLKIVSDTFSNINKTLVDSYKDPTDTTEFYEIDSNGRLFSAKFENRVRKNVERFSKKSISIYVAGCKPMTSEYLFEEFIENCFDESQKYNKRIVKNGGKDSEKTDFTEFMTFLVYDFGTRQFHQIGFSDKYIYELPKKSRRSDNYDVREIQTDLLDFSQEM